MQHADATVQVAPFALRVYALNKRESNDGYAPPIHTLAGLCQHLTVLVCSNHYGRVAEEPSAESFDEFLPRHPPAGKPPADLALVFVTSLADFVSRLPPGLGSNLGTSVTPHFQSAITNAFSTRCASALSDRSAGRISGPPQQPKSASFMALSSSVHTVNRRASPGQLRCKMSASRVALGLPAPDTRTLGHAAVPLSAAINLTPASWGTGRPGTGVAVGTTDPGR